MDTMELYRRAQDGFDVVLAKVPADRWDAPSACTEWTVRDVAGHVIWGQQQMRAWATDRQQVQMDGAPGSPHPAVMAGDDPVATWRAARKESVATLTEEALARMTSITGIGEVPLAAVVTLLITDQVAHTWDIAHGLGIDAELGPELVGVAFDWARANVVRRPGFFGPELTPPADANEQTRMLAFLGRAAWQPVAA
ncbi:TIGR03086 family metal-binding protein [Kibdelosporangium philippinense]|uniref:TIGR03086 family metal-binding protein n=1 Tax=Kibdelosporangium philippinense TaxID=211113 RepID=A0ABS8Z4P0_9PSEU|nr:TIGR03086 family metal-binding protein [Kibdelosporangium philippinense]MCE7001993.1 TIGR03086 family metal-binding protein [Kibdelosporangium philippinense]